MTPTDLLIDDHEFETPLYVSVEKYDPNQRRDQRGRFAEQGSVTVGDREITVVKPKRAWADKLVTIDVAKWEANFQQSKGFYVGPEGKGGIGERYQRFGEFIAQRDSIEAAEVHVRPDGGVGFTNGRHRYAWLRDHGVTQMPVAMDRESLAHAEKHGYLVTKKWDPSKHPRHEAGTGDKGGEFKDSGPTVKLYRGDAATVSPALSYSDPAALFGAGIYLTDSKRIAGDYGAKGGAAEEVFRFGGGPKSTKQEAIDRYIRSQAETFDVEGNKLKWPERLSGYGGEPEDWKDSPRIRDLVKDDKQRLAHAQKEWDAIKDSMDVRKLADNTIVIYKKRPGKEGIGHVSEYEIPDSWIKKTLDAEAPISRDVAAALHDVLRKDNPSLAREVYDKAMQEGEDGFAPSFREVYAEGKDSMLMGGLGEKETQLRLRRALKELGFKGIRYAGGITMGGARHNAYVFWDEQGLKKRKRKWDEVQSIAEKGEHEFGSTQIQIAPTSSAAASLNAARAQISDDDCMATGKDVDPNHVTVRYGLLNDDLDGLRSFLARQQPFEASLAGIELFPASEHSDGAVPVVARIASPELHAIEAEIGNYADFKEKHFPVYKPHCTLAYCKPTVAMFYADLFVHGSFIVQSITISHASGVLETIPFGMTQKWDEGKHKRHPKGSEHGGEFMETLHGPRDALDSLLNKEKDVNIDRNDVRRFLELAREQPEDPDLTDLHVEGMKIFGGNGLGIKREDMPQIPPEHREQFLEFLEQEGVTVTREQIDPLRLKPTQSEVSARRVGDKLRKYEKGDKQFPAVLVSNANRILDGHHHWGMMTAFSLDVPGVQMPITRIHQSTKKTLALMHAYMKRHGLSRASLSGSVVKWDPSQPRDDQGQWTKTGLSGAEAVAAIRRGEPHLASEDAFVEHHVTGYIESDTYKRYEEGDLDFIHKNEFETLLDTVHVNGETVEIRLQTEESRYPKYTEEASPEERDRLYTEYEAAAKALGTTPMMAGIDLGHGSSAYNSLREYEQRWLDSGSHLIRDAAGEMVYYTLEEMQAKGLVPVHYSVGAFVGDRAVGFSGDEFGATGVYLAKPYQRHGIGLTLLKTYLEKSGRLAQGTKIGQMTFAGRELTRALHRKLVQEARAKKKDPASGRYVTPFVSFDRQGDEQLRMIASLNSSRLATWGFTAEAEVRGLARYKLTAVLDGRTSKFCQLIDGRIFEVADARRKVIEVLEVQDPEDLRTVQPWPKQTKEALAMYAEMSSTELMERGLHIPPYHPHCRTICRALSTTAGISTEPPVPTLPEGVESFQTVTLADLKELGVEATQENVDLWNTHIGMTPTELLSRLSGVPPQEVLTKGKGVGSNPIQFHESGNVGFNVRGSSPQGVEFKLNALLDPFTGTYYLTKADLLTGNPQAEMSFLKGMFNALIDMGLKSTATSVAVGVAGNAAYYARLGFLPDEFEWDSLRTHALKVAEPVLASLAPPDRALVEALLHDKSVNALSALVELPFTYQGMRLGEWFFGDAVGTWALDLTDDLMVAQAKAYLS